MNALQQAVRDLRRVKDEIDRAYWLFTRTARGQPPRRELYVERNRLEALVTELQRGRRSLTVIDETCPIPPDHVFDALLGLTPPLQASAPAAPDVDSSTLESPDPWRQ